MKPVSINLAAKKHILERLWLPLVVTFIIVGAGVSFMSIHEYGANYKALNKFESRALQMKITLEEKQGQDKKNQPDPRVIEKLEQNHIYLNRMVEKTLFSLPGFLSELEKIKPEKLEIDEVSFSDELKVVHIKGQSDFEKPISRFILDLNKLPKLSVTLSEHEITGSRGIEFELKLARLEN